MAAGYTFTAGLLRCASAYNVRAPKLGLPEIQWITKLKVRDTGFPVYLRAGTSDYVIFKQIFVEDEYQPLCNLGELQCIVDCGANVGLSSLYFARAFPSARILAVEPDRSNATIFRRNLRCFSDRVELIESAVWSRPAPLKIKPAPVTMEAATSVREVRGQEQPDLFAIDVPYILDRIQVSCIDLLKIDIEGAEAELFREPECHRWLPRVRNIAVELHADLCKARFFQALEKYHYEKCSSGELTICRDIMPRDSLEVPQ